MKIASYPAYRPSGTDWLGEIPTHWEMKRLRYCVSIINEKVNGQGTDLPYIGLENIESWTGRQIQQGAEPSFSEGQSNLFKSGDVLFGKLRPYLAKVLRAKENGICTGELLVLRPKEAIQDYLFYYLLAKNFIDIVDSSTYGAKMPRANWDFIGGLPVLIPNANEQRDIAAFLELVTARIDGLITKKERLIELLQEKRAALISHAVTQGIDPKVPMKNAGIKWLENIPRNWEVKKLKFVVSFYGGGTPSKGNSDYWTGDIPWVSPKDMKSEFVTDTEDHITEDAVKESATRVIQPGAVLLVVRSGILRHTIPVAVNIRPVALNQDMKALVPKTLLQSSYLKYLIIGLQRILLVTWRKEGATVESIEFEFLANTSIPLPPIVEQEDISIFLYRELEKIDSLISKIHLAVEKLREYRTALISDAVTGKIDVRQEVA